MANNLHISYDLKNPGQSYDRVISKIKSLGSWAKIHYSFWYVRTELTASQARDQIVSVLDQNDTVYVVDSNSNEAAWNGINSEVSEFVQQHWFK